MESQVSLKKIECKNCGADLIFDPSTQLNICNFCGSSFQIESATDAEIKKPDGIIPFAVTKEQFLDAVLIWLSEGDYTPDDILLQKEFKEINGVYLPFFLFIGKFTANWSASSGYHYNVEYTEWSNSEKKHVNKTRRETRWQPSNGQVRETYNGCLIANPIVDNTYKEFCEERIFINTNLKPFDSKYTLGYSLIEFTKDSQLEWSFFKNRELVSGIRTLIQRRIPGDTFKDLNYDTDIEEPNLTNVYLPFWLVTYAYQDKHYQICVDGQDSSKISGEKPIDEGRKNKIDSLTKEANKVSGRGCLFIIAAMFIMGSILSALKNELPKDSVIPGLIILVVLFLIGRPTVKKIMAITKQKKDILEKSKETRNKILEKVRNSEIKD